MPACGLSASSLLRAVASSRHLRPVPGGAGVPGAPAIEARRIGPLQIVEHHGRVGGREGDACASASSRRVRARPAMAPARRRRLGREVDLGKQPRDVALPDSARSASVVAPTPSGGVGHGVTRVDDDISVNRAPAGRIARVRRPGAARELEGEAGLPTPASPRSAPAGSPARRRLQAPFTRDQRHLTQVEASRQKTVGRPAGRKSARCPCRCPRADALASRRVSGSGSRPSSSPRVRSQRAN